MRNKIFIVILSITLGIILAFQYQVVKDTAGGIVFSQKVNELNSELKKTNEEKKQLLIDLSELEKKINDYENNAAEESVYVKNLSEELNKFKSMAGYTDLKGPGVVISIDNPIQDGQYTDYKNNLIYNYEYLLLILSNLNAAGAEAISINGQRYTNYTEIVPVGTHLNVNGVAVIPPIEIKAIGNKQTLESVLSFKGGVVWEMRNLNYQIDVKILEEVDIQRQIKIFEFKYAQPFD